MDTFSKIVLLLFMVNTLYFVEPGSTPFSFSKLEGGFSIRTPRRSAIDCCVYRRRPLLSVWRCWKSGVINCIANFQPKRKNSFLKIFGVLLSFNRNSVAAFTRAISRMYENAATVYLNDFGLNDYFLIDDVSTSVGGIVKLYDCWIAFPVILSHS